MKQYSNWRRLIESVVVGMVLRKDKINIQRRALDFNVKGTRRRGRPKKTRLSAAMEESRKVELNECDANNRSRWR